MKLAERKVAGQTVENVVPPCQHLVRELVACCFSGERCVLCGAFLQDGRVVRDGWK